MAVLDRLQHDARVINIRGESYRLKERRKAGLLVTPTSREQTLNKEASKNLQATNWNYSTGNLRTF